MENKEQYKNFSYYYDILMRDIDYKTWGNYIKEIIEKNNVKHNDVLEMACGTGNISIDMAKRGYKVTAFDISEDMLSVASNKAAVQGANIQFLYQDMTNIKIGKDFGIILCLCDSVNYITETSDLANLFKWVYSHLKDNGIFIFDINSSYKLKNIIGNNTFTYNKDDLAYIWDNYMTDENTIEFYVTFFARQGQLYRRFDELHIEKIYETQDILNMLSDAGFSDIGVNEAFTFDSVTKTSERINFIVNKHS